jgi:hypothetical protein
MKKVRNRRVASVNSGWTLLIRKDYGAVWSGSGLASMRGGIFVRRIYFSIRRPKRRYVYGVEGEQRAKKMFRGGTYHRYMVREWRQESFRHRPKNLRKRLP